MCDIDSKTSNKIANMSFVCACLVVCLHTHWNFQHHSTIWWCSKILMAIADVAVPFFFCVSGYFLAKKIVDDYWLKNAIVKRMRTLLVPFFFWNVLFFSFCTLIVLLANITHGCEWGRNLHFSVGTFVKALGFNPIERVGDPPLWYIRCLFLYVLGAPVLFRFANKTGLVLLFSLSIFCFPKLVQCGAVDYGNYATLGVFFISVNGLFWFVFGSWCAQKNCMVRARTTYMLISSIAATLLLIISFWLDGYWSIFTHNLAVPFVMYVLWSITPDSKWPKKLVSASFPVYVLHYFFCLLFRLLNFHPQCAISYPVVVAIEIGLSLTVTFLLRKTMPKICTLIFGGR